MTTLLLVFQIIAASLIITAAFKGKGSRDSYLGSAVALTLIGLAFLSNISDPEPLRAMSELERVGEERLTTLTLPIAWTFFAAAIGALIGACVFRAPRAVDESSPTQDFASDSAWPEYQTSAVPAYVEERASR